MVKGIVKRVTELVTPGVTFNDQVLNSKRIISCFPSQGKRKIRNCFG
jgi:hypothetical protein